MTARRNRIARSVRHHATARAAPFRSRRGALIAWLAVVVVVFGASAVQALVHHAR